MNSKIKNLILFLIIVVILFLIYMFFIKKDANSTNLVSVSVNGNIVPTTDNETSLDFLTLLLNVKSIKLDSSIFSDDSFIRLYDSSIILIPDGNEGRVNPFAPLGAEDISVVNTNTPPTSITR